MELVELVGPLAGQVVGLGPVLRPVELPESSSCAGSLACISHGVLWRVTAVEPLW
jgi:hypothetical protein